MGPSLTAVWIIALLIRVVRCSNNRIIYVVRNRCTFLLIESALMQRENDFSTMDRKEKHNYKTVEKREKKTILWCAVLSSPSQRVLKCNG